QPDASITVEAEDTSRHASQHCFDEPAALEQLLIRGNERITLVLELCRHVVEGSGQPPQITLAAPDRQLNVEVTAGNHLCRRDQAPDRRYELACKPETGPDCRQQGRH